MKVLQSSGSFSQQTVWQYFDRPANGDVEYRRGGWRKIRLSNTITLRIENNEKWSLLLRKSNSSYQSCGMATF